MALLTWTLSIPNPMAPFLHLQFHLTQCVCLPSTLPCLHFPGCFPRLPTAILLSGTPIPQLPLQACLPVSVHHRGQFLLVQQIHTSPSLGNTANSSASPRTAPSPGSSEFRILLFFNSCAWFSFQSSNVSDNIH